MKKPRRAVAKTSRPRATKAVRVSKPRRTKVPTPNFWHAR